ncbi:MAG: hypothetical protein BM485_08685 [Desulfobulbaceae bacterium DB1]|nr:MAG: hypothetical protein BM485_08685 [Desulfobulbaceae bacterium DB1]
MSRHEVIARADQALYAAKNSGRNLVRTWTVKHHEIKDGIDEHNPHAIKKQFSDISHQVKSNYSA